MPPEQAPSSLSKLLDHPWYQLALGLATLVPIALTILSPGFRHWLASFYSTYSWIAFIALIVLLVRSRKANQVLRTQLTGQGVSLFAESPGATDSIGACVPGGAALADYLRSTLFIDGRLEALSQLDVDHHLQTYEKNFRIDGHDIWTEEKYLAQNSSTHPTTGLTLPTLGGSSLRTEEHSASAHQIQDGKPRSLGLMPKHDGERFKSWAANFVTPLRPGDTAEIHFKEFWPRAMTMGFDAVFYTQVLCYARGIGKLSTRIAFDQPLATISAWWYDVQTGECQQDQNPLSADRSNTSARPEYEWQVPNPVPTRLYFIVFDRSPADRLTPVGADLD